MSVKNPPAHLRLIEHDSAVNDASEQSKTMEAMRLRHRALLDRFLEEMKDFPDISDTSECLFLASILLEEAAYSMALDHPKVETASFIHLAATVDKAARRIARLD